MTEERIAALRRVVETRILVNGLALAEALDEIEGLRKVLAALLADDCEENVVRARGWLGRSK